MNKARIALGIGVALAAAYGVASRYFGFSIGRLTPEEMIAEGVRQQFGDAAEYFVVYRDGSAGIPQASGDFDDEDADDLPF